MSEKNLSSCDVVVTAKKRRMKIKLQRFFLILKKKHLGKIHAQSGMLEE